METPSSSPAQGGLRLKGGLEESLPTSRCGVTEPNGLLLRIAALTIYFRPDYGPDYFRPDYCRPTWKRGLQSARRPLTAASPWQAGSRRQTYRISSRILGGRRCCI